MPELSNSCDYNPFLTGERIYLRALTSLDVTSEYVAWMNDPEVTKYLETRFFPQSKETILDFVESQLGSRDNLFLAIILKEDNRHIGNIKLGPINWIHRFAEIGLLIGDKKSWGKGYATESIKIISDFAFNRLNLHKVTAGCYTINESSARAFKRVGFQVEGIRKEHCFFEGQYADITLFGLVAGNEQAI